MSNRAWTRGGHQLPSRCPVSGNRRRSAYRLSLKEGLIYQGVKGRGVFSLLRKTIDDPIAGLTPWLADKDLDPLRPLERTEYRVHAVLADPRASRDLSNPHRAGAASTGALT